MAKINWFKRNGDEWEGFILPKFRIYKDLAGRLRLYIFDDLPKSIIIKSVRAGKIKAAKYLKEQE